MAAAAAGEGYWGDGARAPWRRGAGAGSSAAADGCATLGFLDQMYLLLALVAERLPELTVKERLALKTLVMPGGLGSTMKVLVLAKGVGTPRLAGLSSYARVT